MNLSNLQAGRPRWSTTAALVASSWGLGLTSLAQQAEERQPNILWLDAEDANVNWFGCYGNPAATTPNIDKLAGQGFRYTHAFANAPVCAPSRSGWITGVMALSMGTHPDIPYAHYADAVERMDARVGAVLGRLEREGLADNTIVIFTTDHGGVMPASKRFLTDSGTHTPFIIRIPEKFKHLWPTEEPGMTVDRLVSFVDMPKTWLSLAGAEVPDHMQGRIFLGPDTEPERDTHFAFRGRMDERYDQVRAVRSKELLYIKNYMPFVPAGQRLGYLWRMEATQAWVEHHRAGKEMNAARASLIELLENDSYATLLVLNIIDLTDENLSVEQPDVRAAVNRDLTDNYPGRMKEYLLQ